MTTPATQQPPWWRRRLLVPLVIPLVIGGTAGTVLMLQPVPKQTHAGAPTAAPTAMHSSGAPGATAGGTPSAPASGAGSGTPVGAATVTPGSGGTPGGAAAGGAEPGANGGTGTTTRPAGGSGGGSGTGTGGGATTPAHTPKPTPKPAGSAPAAITAYSYYFHESCIGYCADMPLSLAWKAPSGATGYAVRYSINGAWHSVTTGSLSYVVDGPASGDKVCFALRAADSYGASPWTSTVCVDTPY